MDASNIGRQEGEVSSANVVEEPTLATILQEEQGQIKKLIDLTNLKFTAHSKSQKEQKREKYLLRTIQLYRFGKILQKKSAAIKVRIAEHEAMMGTIGGGNIVRVQPPSTPASIQRQLYGGDIDPRQPSTPAVIKRQLFGGDGPSTSRPIPSNLTSSPAVIKRQLFGGNDPSAALAIPPFQPTGPAAVKKHLFGGETQRSFEEKLQRFEEKLRKAQSTEQTVAPLQPAIPVTVKGHLLGECSNSIVQKADPVQPLSLPTKRKEHSSGRTERFFKRKLESVQQSTSTKQHFGGEGASNGRKGPLIRPPTSATLKRHIRGEDIQSRMQKVDQIQPSIPVTVTRHLFGGDGGSNVKTRDPIQPPSLPVTQRIHPGGEDSASIVRKVISIKPSIPATVTRPLFAGDGASTVRKVDPTQPSTSATVNKHFGGEDSRSIAKKVAPIQPSVPVTGTRHQFQSGTTTIVRNTFVRVENPIRGQSSKDAIANGPSVVHPMQMIRSDSSAATQRMDASKVAPRSKHRNLGPAHSDVPRDYIPIDQGVSGAGEDRASSSRGIKRQPSELVTPHKRARKD